VGRRHEDKGLRSELKFGDDAAASRHPWDRREDHGIPADFLDRLGIYRIVVALAFAFL
jgi:hypothetical protein